MKHLTGKHMIAALTACAMTAAWAAGTDMTNGSSNGTNANGGAAGMSAPSSQPGAAAPSQTQFDALDVNHDGYISKREASALPKLHKEWKSIDTNHDSKLDKSEYAQFESGGGAASSSSGTSQPGTSGGS